MLHSWLAKKNSSNRSLVGTPTGSMLGLPSASHFTDILTAYKALVINPSTLPDFQALVTQNQSFLNHPNRNKTGDTILGMCIQYGYESETLNQALHHLVKSGANINQQNNHGETALMIAARQGSEAKVSLLLELGANPALKNKQGETAEMIAKAEGSVEHLDDAGAPTSAVEAYTSTINRLSR